MKIVWRRWQDGLLKKIRSSESRPVDDGDDESSHVASLMTPSGLVPLHEGLCISTLYDLWVADCDFNITQGMCEDIEEVDGVETFDVATRYRFRVGIGRLFNGDAVRRDIAEMLDADDIVADAKSKAGMAYSHYAIYCDGGEAKFVGGDDENSVINKAENVRNLVCYSWDSE